MPTPRLLAMLAAVATYDQLRLGDSASFARTISESDIYLFAGITGDLNSAHVNGVNGMFSPTAVIPPPA